MRFRSPFICVLALVPLLFAASASGQTPLKPPVRVKGAPGERPRLQGTARVSVAVKTPFVADKAALAVVLEAAKVQAPQGPLEEIKSFQAAFKITQYERPQGSAKTVVKTGNIIWQWMKNTPRRRRRTRPGSNYYLRTLSKSDRDPGVTQALGPSGAWIFEESDGKDPRALSGLAHEEDRKQLNEERQRTEEMIALFQVGKLVTDNARFRFLARRQPLVIRSKTLEVDVIERVAPGQKRPLILRIGVEDHRVYGATFGATADGLAAETLELDTHRFIKVPGETKTVLMPNTVIIYRGGERQLMALARAPTDVKINANLTAKDFRMPLR